MKLIFILLVVFTLKISATGYGQSSTGTEVKTIREIFDNIEKASDYRFFYNDEFESAFKQIDIDTSGDINHMLDKLLSSTGYSYKLFDNDLIVISKDTKLKITKPEFQQNTIKGIVTDENRTPIQGATIVIKGTTRGTITGADGSFSMPNVSAESILVISFIGYRSQEVPVGSNTQLNVTLQEELTRLEEIVVIGYGTQRKSDVTGSIASITSRDFASQPVTRVDQILQGRGTGLQVTNVTGAPGSDVRIRIRGVNSAIGDNNPLFIIDGFVGADYNMLNPNDIESIEVLKDASSTAIYGSRGSNGVILVTTKKGMAGRIKTEYNGKVSLSEVINRYDMLSAGEFAETVNAKNAAYGLGSVFSQTQIDDFYANGGVDWQDEIYRIAYANEHQLSISGGSDRSTFMLSLNYLNNEGIIKNSEFTRYLLRSNINTSLNDKLSLKVNLVGASSNNLNTQMQGGMNTPVVQSLAWAPTTPKYDSQGNYTLFDPVGSLQRNPVALLYDREDLRNRTYATALAGLQYNIVKGITLNSDFFVDYSNTSSNNFSGNYVTNFAPSASTSVSKVSTLQNTTSLSYNQTFKDVHKISAVGVLEVQQSKSNSVNASATNLTFPELKYDNLAQAQSYTIGSGFSKWSLMSMIARFNYSYNDKYLFSASLRRDGSSKFQEDNRWSIFPALSVGWNLGQEDFIKNIEMISNLKLRGSWGFTGSQAVGPYATQSTYTSTRFAFNNTGITNGIWLGNPGNVDLRWETTEQKNIGIELGLFNNRLSIEGDLFVKNTTDLLLNRPLPFYVGGGTITSNVGEIENKGWELLINGVILDGSLVWRSSFNVSHVKNTVISLGGIANRIFTGSNTTGIAVQSEFIYEPGLALGSYWGLKYLGTWKPGEAEEAALYNKVPGDAKYQDLNNNHEINNDDYQVIGNGFPKYSTGFNNTLEYKNFDLNIFLTGVFGVDKLNSIRGSSLMAARDQRQATLSEIRNRYIPGVNENSDFPGFSTTNQTMTQSSQFIERGDFIRLKNLSIGYTIPRFLNGNIENAKILLNASNILTFTKYKGLDPEASSYGSNTDLNQSIDFGAYPNAKSYSLSISFAF